MEQTPELCPTYVRYDEANSAYEYGMLQINGNGPNKDKFVAVGRAPTANLAADRAKPLAVHGYDMLATLGRVGIGPKGRERR